MVGAPDKAEERFRNEQLLARADSLVSFCMRPLSYKALHYIENKKIKEENPGGDSG